MCELPFGGLHEEYLPCDWRYIAALEAGIVQAAETIAAELRGTYEIDVDTALLRALLRQSNLIPRPEEG